jgi:hypothetical protein
MFINIYNVQCSRQLEDILVKHNFKLSFYLLLNPILKNFFSFKFLTHIIKNFPLKISFKARQ